MVDQAEKPAPYNALWKSKQAALRSAPRRTAGGESDPRDRTTGPADGDGSFLAKLHHDERSGAVSGTFSAAGAFRFQLVLFNSHFAKSTPCPHHSRSRR
ncbi:MAG: hypothetical protein OEU56_11145 [Rhodospirillales bacterium]|nr:hypothetical protein [Rhodospirillales bacterium]